jgi:hypothetical protein
MGFSASLAARKPEELRTDFLRMRETLAVRFLHSFAKICHFSVGPDLSRL